MNFLKSGSGAEAETTTTPAPLPLYGLHGSGGGGGRVIDARRDIGAAAAGELRVSDFEVGQAGTEKRSDNLSLILNHQYHRKVLLKPQM